MLFMSQRSIFQHNLDSFHIRVMSQLGCKTEKRICFPIVNDLLSRSCFRMLEAGTLIGMNDCWGNRKSAMALNKGT